MGGAALSDDVRPREALVRDDDIPIGGFRHDGGVSRHPAVQNGLGADAVGLFVGDGRQDDVPS